MGAVVSEVAEDTEGEEDEGPGSEVDRQAVADGDAAWRVWYMAVEAELDAEWRLWSGCSRGCRSFR